MSFFDNKAKSINLVQAVYGSSQPSPGKSDSFAKEDHRHGFVTDDVSWTPDLSSASNPQPVDGATPTGNYSIIGKKCFFELQWVLNGSSTLGTGLFSISLPFTEAALNTTAIGRSNIIGSVFVRDSNTTTTYSGHAIWNGTGTNTFSMYMHGGAAGISATVPITFATSDLIRVQGWVPLL